ncbi:MAG: tRNA (cytidine(34)-2'-O)-methyltransferase [Nitrosomonadales bacterium]|jgi:tRNA (cytidine/uridine-2'-O-)-methyltransferase|nr:tRNA (cytidine(34)-2'-O)-methyltransferase [Nitrosomonadales bacterium]MBT3918041.1 tRNA (cytidine(34)-2'-O)-methyltransferase [Nitrosomonadales bacterium]MBT4183526.1 tRNA (cytidine(34)-2'-O)-methyltransferase [Nitrosomonadales bacterium]MBT4571103.1 tRNA (cytidine(34)-2'-O)-methyltransferase [Nitrosomonadales bacterium]MBT5150367.1 tRNA (cytidine(34)-2'-O)-methyltransferase [Nitrosomonadales bacterium]
MFNIILFEPEIPPNTGNIIRLCVNTNSTLHLIKPYGFDLSSKNLRRAGLDYIDLANVKEHDTFNDCYKTLISSRFYAVTTKATSLYTKSNYKKNDSFIFGPETRGLPNKILESEKIKTKIRIPMVRNNRSLNLSNSVGVIVYEAWRQLNFDSGN